MSEFPVHDACANLYEPDPGAPDLVGDRIRELARQGASLNQIEERGNAPLHVAVNRGNDKAVKALLELGARTDVYDEDGLAPLHLAAAWGQVETVKMLLAAGANPNDLARERDTKSGGFFSFFTQGTPAFVACKLAKDSERDHASALRALLAAGADPNLPGPRGNKPLHMACESKKAVLVGLLLEAGADVDAPNDNGESALLVAARRGAPESVVALLLAAGADIDGPVARSGPSARDHALVHAHLQPVVAAHLAERTMGEAIRVVPAAPRSLGL